MGLNVYIVLWIDQYGMFQYKTFFLAILPIFKAIGSSFGLLLNYYLTPAKYPTQFLIEGIILISIGILISFYDRMYFSSKIWQYKTKNIDEDFKFKGHMVSHASEDAKIEEANKGESIFKYRESRPSIEKWYVPEVVYVVVTNPVYASGLFASTILVTCQTGFSMWSVNYINDFFQNKTTLEKLMTNIGISFTGPVGALICNCLITCKVGGYHSRTTPIFMFIFYLITTVTGNMIPFVTNKALNIILICLFFIGANAMVPYLSGTNLSGGTPSKKPFGVTTATLINTLFGAAPSGFIFGYLKNKLNGDVVMAVNYLMKYLIIGLIFDFLMCYFKVLSYPKKEEVFKETEGKELEEKA